MENWKTINGFSNYEISDLGRVRSIRRKGSKGGILKPKIREDLRHKVGLMLDNGKSKDFFVHRLVALHFLPNYYGKTQIDHINNNPQDNRVYNLRWVSDAENKLNTRLRKSNYSGKKGVFFYEKRNKWVALVSLGQDYNNKQIMKHFKTFEDACKWRDEVVKIYYDDKYYTE